MNPVFGRFAFSTLLVVSAILLALALAEVMLRIFAPQFDVVRHGLYQYDSERGYRLIPNLRQQANWGSMTYRIETNSRSQRDRERDTDAQLTILAIGDSHTFGSGVDQHETYPARLEASLTRQRGRRVEVINAGTPAYGWLEQRALLDQLPGTQKPDLIILQTSWNDINDNAMGNPKFLIDPGGNLIRSRGRKRPGGYGRWGMKSRTMADWQRFALKHSHVATLLIGNWYRLDYALNQERIERDIERYKWQVSRDALAAMVAQTQRLGIPMVAVLHPGTRPEYLAKRREFLDQVSELLAQNSIPVLDLAAGIAALEDAGALFIPGDEHFNRDGYRWMVTRVVEFLTAEPATRALLTPTAELSN